IHDAMAGMVLVVLEMDVPVHDGLLFNALQRLLPHGFARHWRDDLLIRARRRVAIENTVDQERRWPRRHALLLLLRPPLLHEERRCVFAIRERDSIHVPGEKLRSFTEGLRQLECLARPRAPDEIAAEDDRVDARRLDLLEDGFEGARIAVDVVQ